MGGGARVAPRGACWGERQPQGRGRGGQGAARLSVPGRGGSAVRANVAHEERVAGNLDAGSVCIGDVVTLSACL